MKKNNENIYDRALARAQEEIADVLNSVKKKNNYREKESKTLIKELGQSIVPLDNQRKQINTLLKSTTDKGQRQQLLEEHHKVVNKIQSFWENKEQKWNKDIKDIDEE